MHAGEDVVGKTADNLLFKGLITFSQVQGILCHTPKLPLAIVDSHCQPRDCTTTTSSAAHAGTGAVLDHWPAQSAVSGSH